MEIAVQVPHIGRFATASFVREYCEAAEAAGFAGLWTVDHLVVPSQIASRYPLSETPRAVSSEAMRSTMGLNLEQNTTLAVAAAVTSRIRLGTAVAVVPLRHPIVNARQLASIDLFAGGRLQYGVGVGWLREEVDALGGDWHQRGPMTEEHIEILRQLWSAPEEGFAYRGRFWTLPSMDPRPQPPRGTIPILIGGYSDAALDRVARIGDGWVTARMSPERFSRLRAEIVGRCEDLGRDVDALEFVGWASGPSSRVEDPREVGSRANDIIDEIQHYADAGVTQLRVGGDVNSPEDALTWLEQFGKSVLTEIS